MVVLVTWTETTILINGVPTRRSSLRNEISSIRHSDDESYGCENHRVLLRYRHRCHCSLSYRRGLLSQSAENNCPYHRVVGF